MKAGIKVINTQTEETGHVFHVEEIEKDKFYWFRTRKSPSSGYSGKQVSGKNLKKLH